MTPELAALATLWSLVIQGGPWFVVFSLVVAYQWSLSNGKLFLAREYQTLLDKAAKREIELVGEVEFWKLRYLSETDTTRTAIGAVGALSTTRGPR